MKMSLFGFRIVAPFSRKQINIFNSKISRSIG